MGGLSHSMPVQRPAAAGWAISLILSTECHLGGYDVCNHAKSEFCGKKCVPGIGDIAALSVGAARHLKQLCIAGVDPELLLEDWVDNVLIGPSAPKVVGFGKNLVGELLRCP